MTPPVFRRYLGIHYAGAKTPDSGLKSLRVYSATPETPPQRKLPLKGDSSKMEASASSRKIDEEVAVHGGPDHGDPGRGLLRVAGREGGVLTYALRAVGADAVDADEAMDRLVDVIVSQYAPPVVHARVSLSRDRSPAGDDTPTNRG